MYQSVAPCPITSRLPVYTHPVAAVTTTRSLLSPPPGRSCHHHPVTSVTTTWSLLSPSPGRSCHHHPVAPVTTTRSLLSSPPGRSRYHHPVAPFTTPTNTKAAFSNRISLVTDLVKCCIILSTHMKTTALLWSLWPYH